MNILRERFPERAPTIPEGDPEKAIMESYKADATKSERILGIKWTPIEHTVVDILMGMLLVLFSLLHSNLLHLSQIWLLNCGKRQISTNKSE